MLAQVGLHGWGLATAFSWFRLVIFLLIVLAWINTFFFAVSLHNQIAAKQYVLEAATGLVKVNWYRTVLWSLVFLLGLVKN